MIDNLRNAIQKKISRQSFGMWQEYLSLRYQLRSGLQRILQRRARLMRRAGRRWRAGAACQRAHRATCLRRAAAGPKHSQL